LKPPRAITTSAALKWFGWTDRGKVRPNNEDAFVGLQFDAREVHLLGRLGEAATANADFAFAVSDGMGGANAGELASRIAVEKITTLLPRSFKQSAIGIEAGFEDVLSELFGETHRALAYVGGSYEETSGMEATLSLCWFTPGWMYFGHIGDSRIYYLPAAGEEIKQLSHDDTHVGWLFRQGKLNEREARTHPRRNALQQALGAGHQFIKPHIGAVAHRPGDKFLLCSDGLVDGLWDRQLEEGLRRVGAPNDKHSPAQLLVEPSVQNSGRDNTTAVVVEVTAPIAAASVTPAS
jgi:protein phosphatase